MKAIIFCDVGELSLFRKRKKKYLDILLFIWVMFELVKNKLTQLLFLNERKNFTHFLQLITIQFFSQGSCKKMKTIN